MEAATGPDVALVGGGSVDLKWVLREPDSCFALAIGDTTLPVPSFWLDEVCSVLWLQIGKQAFAPGGAREELALLRGQVEPTAPTGLHDVALEVGLAINQSIYDTLNVAFAIAMGAANLMVADERFVRDI